MRCLILLLGVSLPLVGTDLLGADAESDAGVQIGELNEAYVTAFNHRDAAKVGALFGADGDFTLLTGDTIGGRGSITAAHASFFDSNPQAKISGEQTSCRFLRPDIAIATGKWEVKHGPSEYSSTGVWATVLKRTDGTWRYEAMRLMIPEKPSR